MFNLVQIVPWYYTSAAIADHNQYKYQSAIRLAQADVVAGPIPGTSTNPYY